MSQSTPDQDGEDGPDEELAEAIEEFEVGDTPSEEEVAEIFSCLC